MARRAQSAPSRPTPGRCSAASTSSSAPSSAPAASTIPNTLTRGNENVEHEAEATGFFYTDAISDQAVAYIEQHQRERAGRSRSSRTSPTPRRTGRCTRTTRTSRSTRAASTRAGTRCARSGSTSLVDVGHSERRLEAHRPRPDPAALDEGRAEGVAAALHGGLRRADRPHGPGHRPHRRGAREDGPARQHPDHLPGRQRRLRRGHPGQTSRSTSSSTS